MKQQILFAAISLNMVKADTNAAGGSNTDGRITWNNANAWVADFSINGIDG